MDGGIIPQIYPFVLESLSRVQHQAANPLIRSTSCAKDKCSSSRGENSRASDNEWNLGSGTEFLIHGACNSMNFTAALRSRSTNRGESCFKARL